LEKKELGKLALQIEIKGEKKMTSPVKKGRGGNLQSFPHQLKEVHASNAKMNTENTGKEKKKGGGG